jgi:hypothetical protein
MRVAKWSRTADLVFQAAEVLLLPEGFQGHLAFYGSELTMLSPDSLPVLLHPVLPTTGY